MGIVTVNFSKNVRTFLRRKEFKKRVDWEEESAIPIWLSRDDRSGKIWGGPLSLIFDVPGHGDYH
jgi:hypothetical protein